MNEQPTKIRGVLYPSQKAAAKALGFARGSISSALRRKGHCEDMGERRYMLGNNRASAGPIVIGGFEFRSKLEAMRELGVTQHAVYSYARGDMKRKTREALCAAIMRYSQANPSQGRRLTATPKGGF